MPVKLTKFIRFIALLTLVLVLPHLYSLLTFMSSRQVTLERYSLGYSSFLVFNELVLVPFVVAALSPGGRWIGSPKRVTITFVVCWVLCLFLFILGDHLGWGPVLALDRDPGRSPHPGKNTTIVLFHNLRWFYCAIFALFSFLATGGLLQFWSEKLFARWKMLAFRTSAVSFGLMCVTGVAEVILRLRPPAAIMFEYSQVANLMQNHPLLGWVNRSGSVDYVKSSEFNHRVSINRKGLRGKEYSYSRQPGVRRILCLGDSFTWGFGVEQSKGFTGALENELLKDVEVINAGIVGYGTTQEWLWFREEGLKYRPDLVILDFCANDFEDDAPPALTAGERYPRPWCVIKDGALVLKNSPVSSGFLAAKGNPPPPMLDSQFYVYRLLRFSWHTFLKGLSEGKLSSNTESLNALASKKVAEALFKEIGRLAKENGATFLVVIIPTAQEVRPSERDAPAAFPNLRTAYHDALEVCRSNGLDYLDLGPSLAQAEDRGQHLYYDRDGHWNEVGHRIAAEAISKKVLGGAWLQERNR